jgi:hypothetical protein
LGTVFGIVAAGSSLGAIAMNDGVAKLVQGSGYTLWYVIAAGLHLMAIVVLLLGVWPRRPKDPRGEIRPDANPRTTP